MSAPRCRLLHYRLLRGLLGLSLGLCACEEVVEPDFGATPQILVVEAEVNNLPGRSYVRLTNTQAFDSPVEAPAVSEAEIFIDRLDANGAPAERIRFSESTQAPGWYWPASDAFVGQPQTTYRLIINTAQGRRYEATGPLGTPPNLLQVQAQFRENDPVFLETGHYVSVTLQDAAGQADHYLCRLFAEGQLLTDEGFLLFDDQQIDGQPITEVLPLVLTAPVGIRLECATIPEAAHDYYRSLNALGEAGSPTGAVPENPPTNLSGGALGYFNTPAFMTDTLWIPTE